MKKFLILFLFMICGCADRMTLELMVTRKEKIDSYVVENGVGIRKTVHRIYGNGGGIWTKAYMDVEPATYDTLKEGDKVKGVWFSP